MISPNSSHGGGVSTPRCGASSRLMWAVILLGCIRDGKVDVRDAFVAVTPSSWAVLAFLAGRYPDFSAASPVAFPCVLAATLLIFLVGSFVVFIAALLGRFLEARPLLSVSSISLLRCLPRSWKGCLRCSLIVLMAWS